MARGEGGRSVEGCIEDTGIEERPASEMVLGPWLLGPTARPLSVEILGLNRATLRLK